MNDSSLRMHQLVVWLNSLFLAQIFGGYLPNTVETYLGGEDDPLGIIIISIIDVL